MAKNALAIVLSVSGETAEILRFASQFSLHRCKVLSITSHDTSSLAKLADFNLSWHVPQTRIAGVYDITTQVPVIYILETLGRKMAKKKKKKNRLFFICNKSRYPLFVIS